jgi:predicted CopG family antitoxin
MALVYLIGMSSTTIKLDHEILSKLTCVKPAGESVSAFVRHLIEKEYRERELRKSAAAYEKFLRDNPREREAMEEWESAPLVNEVEPPRP